MRYLVRAAVNLVNGSTATGVLVAFAGRARLRRGPDRLLIAAGYQLPVPPAPAFCVGNVVLIRTTDLPSGSLRHARKSRLLSHEARHATQFAWCGGVLMIPLYLAAAGASWVICGDFGAWNVFERLAGLADGGYTPKQPRWSAAPAGQEAVEAR